MAMIKKVKKTEIAVPLKYLSNFWRNLDMSLINCEISLILSWSENCVITSLEKILIRAAEGDNPEERDNSPTNAVFKITDCQLYVPVVTLSSEDNKLLDQLKSGFKRTIKWNKYMSQMPNQTANNNLNYLTDPTFSNVNEEERTSLEEDYVPKVEIKDYNVIIDRKPFFEIPVKSKEESYEKLLKYVKIVIALQEIY